VKWLRSERSLGSWRFALACLVAMGLVIWLMLATAQPASADHCTEPDPYHDSITGLCGPTPTTTTTIAPTTTTVAPECDSESLTLEQESLCSIAYNMERSRAETLTGLALILALGGAAFIAGLWLRA
jgi:hypothetical protein